MLVCTLPSPACMCSATNTRPFSTRAWIASMFARIGSNGRPSKSCMSGSRTSVFQDTRCEWFCNVANTVDPPSAVSSR